MTNKVTLNDITAFDNSIISSYSVNNDTLETAFNNTLSRDGTSPNTMGASLDMNSNNIINLAKPKNSSDAARLQDITDTVLLSSGSLSNLTSHGVLYVDGTNSATSTVAPTNGQIIVGVTGSPPAPVSVSGDGTLSSAGALAVTKINGVALGSTTATSGNQLIGSGTQWVSVASSGDVTNNSSGVRTIANGAVTLGKMANLAANSVIGNNTGSSATPLALTTAQLTAMVNPVTSSLSGAAPASGGGTLTFLRADATWATPPGSMTLLNTLTASNSASLTDITSLTSTYSLYEIIILNLVPATNNTQLQMQVHSGGNYITSSYITQIFGGRGGVSVINSSLTTALGLMESASAQNSGSGMSGRLTIYSPSSTTAPKMINGLISGYNGTSVELLNVAGYWSGGNGAVDGFKVLFDSGNITSGSIKIYGIV